MANQVEHLRAVLSGLRAHLAAYRRQVSGRDRSGAWRSDLMVCGACGRREDEGHGKLCTIGIALTGIDNALTETPVHCTSEEK